MGMNAGSAPPRVAKRTITSDFTGDPAADSLVPMEKVDALLTAKGSMLETEVKFINGRITTVWKMLPDSVRDIWFFAATVSTQTFPLTNAGRDKD